MLADGNTDEQGRAGLASPLRTALEALARLKPEQAVEIGDPGDDPGPAWRTAAAVWTDDEALERLLAAQAAFTVDLDRKAQAAYLVIDHSMTVSIAVVVPLLVSGVVPSIVPEGTALRFQTSEARHRGRMVEELKGRLRLLSPAFSTHDARWLGHPDSCPLPDRAALLDHMRGQIENHFRPLIRRLYRLTALPPHAMWRLVGDSVSAVFLETGRQLGCEEQAKTDALTVLKQAGSPLSNRQMHYFDIVIRAPGDPGRILASRTFRARGGCCRYYTSHEGRLCTTCVLLDPGERDRNLEARLRTRLGLASPAPFHPG